MNSFLEFLLCLFATWLVYRFLRMAVADGIRDALRETIDDEVKPTRKTYEIRLDHNRP